MLTDRRASFRELIGRLDPAAAPKLALEQGSYVEPKGAVGGRIATALELRSDSSHMLVGGIGSGKTTQLLRVSAHLEQVGDSRAFYVDVLARQREDKLKQGVLLALAALALGEATDGGDDDFVNAKARSIETARGYWLDAYDAFLEGQTDAYLEEVVWKPGILTPPESDGRLEQLCDDLATMANAMSLRPVLLFDGLDRASDIAAFAQLVAHDIPRLVRAGVGVVVVAPQYARTWQHGALHDVFDEIHLHGATPLGDDDRGFLVEVLKRRVADSPVLPDEACDRLALQSGGLLRDLLSLARAACEEAYRLGDDVVARIHVHAAADRFGRSLLVGITNDMIERLRGLPKPRVQTKPREAAVVPFTVATDTDVMLLLRRLVIEVPTTPVHYILHPTITPLIHGLQKRA